MIKRRTLLVEGVDDLHVMRAILNAHGLEGAAEVIKHDGRTDLLDAVPVRLKESNVEVVGVVFDADESIDASWQAIRNRLIDAGFDMPAEPVRDGTIVHPPAGQLLPRVGIWLMPNNEQHGVLEHFLQFLIGPDDALHELARTTVRSVVDTDRRFPPQYEIKALMHTWLAWQEYPGRPLGTSITAKYLDANLPEAVRFAGWLRALYPAEIAVH